MDKELKDEINSMLRHVDFWIDEARLHIELTNKPCNRSLDNALNGTLRIRDLIKEE